MDDCAQAGCEIHDIAQGGIALLDGTGWFHAPDYVGMESAWDKIHYNPVFGKQTDWSFEEYTPQVVIIAIGQNDNHPDDYMKEDYDGEKALHWRSNYEKLLGRIREKYPNAWIICITTLLEHDPHGIGLWRKSAERYRMKNPPFYVSAQWQGNSGTFEDS